MNFQRSFEQLLENRAWVWLSDWPLTLCGAIIILSSKAAFGYHNWHHFGRLILFLISNLIGCRNDLVILLFRAESKFSQRLFHKILGRDQLRITFPQVGYVSGSIWPEPSSLVEAINLHGKSKHGKVVGFSLNLFIISPQRLLDMEPDQPLK